MNKRRYEGKNGRYRRKKKLLSGSLVIIILGILLVAVLSGMKGAEVLKTLDTSFAPIGTASMSLEVESTVPFSSQAGEDPSKNDGADDTGDFNISIGEPNLKSDFSNGNSVTGDVLLDAPYISQLGVYPTGCESVSAVMALQYLGIDITVDQFIDDYLDLGSEPWLSDSGAMYGGDPWKTFLGDPREASGWGCYAPVIEKAIRKAVDTERYQVSALFGIPLEVLCETYLEQNIPVIVWGTIDMEYPTPGDCWLIEGTKRELQWMRPEHCLLLVGYDQEFYYFNDPTAGKQYAYEKGDCEAAYEGLHAQAVVVYER